MDLRKITDDYSVSPQIAPMDVPAIVEAGFRSIMCNRPDDEDPGQCCYDDLSEAARAAGLEVCSVPITSGVVRPEDLTAFQAALEQMPKPVLAYCRSGTRCTMLWAIAQFGQMAPEDIILKAADAGYDMSGLVGQLARR